MTSPPSHAPRLVAAATASSGDSSVDRHAAPVHPPGPSSQAATAAQDEVLNAQALAGLAQLDPTGATQLVRRVLETYLSSLARLLQQFQAAWVAQDVAALRLSVHTLKSSSASIGALGLSECCAKTELAVREGRLDEVERLMPSLLAESERVDAAVRQRLAA